MSLTFNEMLDQVIMWELYKDGFEHHLILPATYLVAMNMGGEWVLKVGHTFNFYKRVKQLNNDYEIQGDVFFNYSYEIPRIIPLVVFFTSDIGDMTYIENKTKYFMHDSKNLTRQTHRFGGKMTEVSNLSGKVYDEFVNNCKNCEGDMWESTVYEIDDANTFSYNYEDDQLVLN